MHPLQIILSQNRLTAPGMRFLAYVKNDILKPKIWDLLIEQMMPGWQEMRILDIGSGPCGKLKDRRFRSVDITCLDIFKPYLSFCKKLGFKVVHGDAKKLKDYFKPKSYDIVLLIDVLEHFKKSDGKKVLAEVEKIARRQIVIWTPLGWYPHDYECVDEPWKKIGGLQVKAKNKHQQHLSAWYPKDLERIGYKCTVLRDYHPDIRSASNELKNHASPVLASQMWAIKLCYEET